MPVLFLVMLFVGLGFGAFVMWRGVERHGGRAPAADSLGRELPAQPVSHMLPVVAAAFFSFGFVGYVLTRQTQLETGSIVAIASLGMVVAGLGTFLALSRWIVPAARLSPGDPRYALQGLPALLTTGIENDGAGTIAYEANGRSVTMRARSADGISIRAGTDVVIDRIEDGVAYIELWSRVEERL